MHRPVHTLTGDVSRGQPDRKEVNMPKKVTRDAGTGRFVPKREAVRRPKTTVTETVPVPKPKKKTK